MSSQDGDLESLRCSPSYWLSTMTAVTCAGHVSRRNSTGSVHDWTLVCVGATVPSDAQSASLLVPLHCSSLLDAERDITLFVAAGHTMRIQMAYMTDRFSVRGSWDSGHATSRRSRLGTGAGVNAGRGLISSPRTTSRPENCRRMASR